MNPTKTYTPQAGSLASQVCCFFRNNPTEELTLDDITDKFMASRGNVHTLLIQAREAGLLAREKNAEGDYIYKAGENLMAMRKDAPIADSAEGDALISNMLTAFAPKRKLGEAVLVPALDTLVIEDNVPRPGTGRPKVNWRPVMTLLKPGQSTVLPLRARSSLQREITAGHKAKAGAWMLQAQPQTETLRLWRTA